MHRTMWLAIAYMMAGPAAAPFAACDDDSRGHGDRPPYPCSEYIPTVTWNCADRADEAEGGDLWPVAWAADGHLYTAFGDGWGFRADDPHWKPGEPDRVTTKRSWGFTRLEGDFSGWSATDLACFSSGKSGRGKIASMFPIRGGIHMLVLEQRSVPDYSIWYVTDLTFPSRCINACPTILWSGSQPAHRTKARQARADGRFYPSGAVNYGQDYAGHHGYVYITGGNWIWSEGNTGYLYMARAGIESDLCSATSWEYLVGPDTNQDNLFDGGTPEWTTSPADRTAIYYDPNGIGNAGGAQILRMPALNRYILTVGHTPGHEKRTPGVGSMGIFESVNPWGPWKTVFYYDDWCGQGGGENLLYHIVPKWVSRPGSEVTVPLVYSGDPPDSFNLVEGTFTLRPSRLEPR
jgi:hypothetical protein